MLTHIPQIIQLLVKSNVGFESVKQSNELKQENGGYVLVELTCLRIQNMTKLFHFLQRKCFGQRVLMNKILTIDIDHTSYFVLTTSVILFKQHQF